MLQQFMFVSSFVSTWGLTSADLAGICWTPCNCPCTLITMHDSDACMQIICGSYPTSLHTVSASVNLDHTICSRATHTARTLISKHGSLAVHTHVCLSEITLSHWHNMCWIAYLCSYIYIALKLLVHEFTAAPEKVDSVSQETVTTPKGFIYMCRIH